MMSVDQFDLHPRIVKALNRAKIHKHERVLTMSGPDLCRATKLSIADVALLQKTVAQAVNFPKVVTALEILENSVDENRKITHLSTGCEYLNAFLKGGILSRGITEIAGESSSGKTQMCLQLCLTCQLNRELGGLGGGAMYICTEDVFPNKRLVQMIDSFQSKPAGRGIDYGSNIFIEHAADLDGLSYCVKQRVPLLLSHGRVRLVIIDSIAALFRCEFDAKQTFQRAKQICLIGSQLHQLCHKYNLPIVCINQVTANVSGNDPQGRALIPALGLSWSNIVLCRLMLSRTDYTLQLEKRNQFGEVTNHFDTPVRQIQVTSSPYLPNSVMNFYVDQEGVKGYLS